jgi:uncharacterized MAPEG superfamily protein
VTKEVRLRKDLALPSPTNASGRAMRAQPNMEENVGVLLAETVGTASGGIAAAAAATAATVDVIRRIHHPGSNGVTQASRVPSGDTSPCHGA